MKKIQQKNIIQIGIAVVLSLITLAAIYGFGWAISAEKNVLLALSTLPENQKWKIDGNFSLLFEQLESPIILDFAGEADYGMKSGKFNSRWRLESDFLGSGDLFNLARDSTGWMFEIPRAMEGQIWHIASNSSEITRETIIRWVRELQFEKAGYQSLEREFGGNVSCLHLVSTANPLPAKFIDWLVGLSEKDLTAERKQELQNMIKDNLAMAIDCFVTPDLKIMQLNIALSLQGNFTAELVLNAWPQKGAEPSLEYYQTKEKVEVDAAMLESFLKELEKWNQGVEK